MVEKVAITKNTTRKIYEVRSVSKSDGKLHYWGAKNTKDAAESILRERFTGAAKNWAEKYHCRWWIEEIDTMGLFELPDRPAPRDKYRVNTTPVESQAGAWNTLRVDILDIAGNAIAHFDRNYPIMYGTFEPFRQGEKLLALVSPDYTTTAVMDLETGKIIASETPNSYGFCPVGFYVPDWWDIHDDSILPGSSSWTTDMEQPNGNFGFVWGCLWGDDSSWKVQYLDLSRVQHGEILRDERFGYVQLATHPALKPKDFINCSFYGGTWKVTFSVISSYDLLSGKREPHEFE